MNANKEQSDSRLFAFIRGLLKIFTNHLHYVFGGDSQVVRYYPEPIGAGMIAIGGDGAYRDSTLARYAYVGGRLMAGYAEIDIVGGQGVHNRVGSGILVEFSPDRNAVAMKYGAVHNAERRHGDISFGCQQAGQVTIDFEFDF